MRRFHWSFGTKFVVVVMAMLVLCLGVVGFTAERMLRSLLT